MSDLPPELARMPSWGGPDAAEAAPFCAGFCGATVPASPRT